MPMVLGRLDLLEIPHLKTVNAEPPIALRAITWLSGTQWHSAKCRSQKSGICHNLSFPIETNGVFIHILAKCTDWSLIQVTARTV